LLSRLSVLLKPGGHFEQTKSPPDVASSQNLISVGRRRMAVEIRLAMKIRAANTDKELSSVRQLNRMVLSALPGQKA
jgi:hypothetical protein